MGAGGSSGTRESLVAGGCPCDVFRSRPLRRHIHSIPACTSHSVTLRPPDFVELSIAYACCGWAPCCGLPCIPIGHVPIVFFFARSAVFLGRCRPQLQTSSRGIGVVQHPIGHCLRHTWEGSSSPKKKK